MYLPFSDADVADEIQEPNYFEFGGQLRGFAAEQTKSASLPSITLDGAITFVDQCVLWLAQRSEDELSALAWLSGIIPGG